MNIRNLRAWPMVILIVLVPGSSLVGQEQGSPFLLSAIEVANWLESVAIVEGDEARWPKVPDESTETDDSLYSGNPGVVLFFLELHRATGDAKYLNWAKMGANRLVRISPQQASDAEPGLFTGTAGQAWTLVTLGTDASIQEYVDASQELLGRLATRVQCDVFQGFNTARWNEITDIIAGSAGIGLVYLEAWRQTGRSEYFELAMEVGDGLRARAIQTEANDETVFKWMMSPDFPREMPNYSHGTAGICDFLLKLDKECRRVATRQPEYDGRFLLAALKGAKYVVSLSKKSPTGFLPHHLPSEADLYYFGWCHGPAGTIGLFERATSVDADSDWLRQAKVFQATLLKQLLDSELPRRNAGFWNNVSVCCGNAGVISALIDNAKPGDVASDLAHQLAEDLLARSTRLELKGGCVGRYWKQAEHRVRPDFEQAQTGLMQGAAGIGLILLKLDSFTKGQPTTPRLPALPF